MQAEIQIIIGQENPKFPSNHPVNAGIATLANCPTMFMLPERVPQNRPPISEQAVQLGGITKSLQKLEHPIATIAQRGSPIKAENARKQDAPAKPITAIIFLALPARPTFRISHASRYPQTREPIPPKNRGKPERKAPLVRVVPR